jgi:hypothetical protein
MQEHNSQLNRRKFLGSIGVIGAVAGLSPFKVFSKTTPVVEELSGSMNHLTCEIQ